METRLSYWMNLAIAVDQFVNALFGGPCDETISAYVHRKRHKRIEAFINWLFNDPNHCALSYVSEMRGEQNATEYKR